jgi:feruloyl esterase
MKRLFLHTLAALLPAVALAAAPAAPLAAAAPSASVPDCAGLTSLKLANTTVTASTSIPAGAFSPPNARGGRALNDLPAFCQVLGVLAPTARSAIKFEVWLPAANWNGKLQVVGNGGLAGTIGYPAMAAALRSGFVTASTDTGHTATEPPTWLEDRERLIDYSYRGLHLTTVDAKAILQSYYRQQARDAYYTGCSTGVK